MSEEKKYKVHLSGYSTEEKSKLKKLVESLRGVVEENLTFHTQFLICKTVLCHKYQAGKNMKVPAVREAWIYDSSEAGQWREAALYELSYLEGLRVGVIGFDRANSNELVGASDAERDHRGAEGESSHGPGRGVHGGLCGARDHHERGQSAELRLADKGHEQGDRGGRVAAGLHAAEHLRLA